METATKRSTVYFEPGLHKALRLKSVQAEKPISELVNEAVRLALQEDSIDLDAMDVRRKEPSRSFDLFLKELKRDGLL